MVPNGTYPQLIHNMWGLIFTGGRDVALSKGWQKVRWRYRGEAGRSSCPGPLAKPSPKREGGNEPGAGSLLISHDHALHDPAYLSTTPTCTFPAHRAQGPQRSSSPLQGRSMQDPGCELPRT